MKAEHDITWRWSLDDDADCFFGRLNHNDIRDVVHLIEFLLRRDVSKRNLLAFCLGQDGNRDMPEGELVSIDIAEVVGFLVLDCDLKVIDCLRWVNVDRERSILPINKTEKAQAIVVHSVAKHRERW